MEERNILESIINERFSLCQSRLKVLIDHAFTHGQHDINGIKTHLSNLSIAIDQVIKILPSYIDKNFLHEINDLTKKKFHNHSEVLIPLSGKLASFQEFSFDLSINENGSIKDLFDFSFQNGGYVEVLDNLLSKIQEDIEKINADESFPRDEIYEYLNEISKLLYKSKNQSFFERKSTWDFIYNFFSTYIKSSLSALGIEGLIVSSIIQSFEEYNEKSNEAAAHIEKTIQNETVNSVQYKKALTYLKTGGKSNERSSSFLLQA